MNGVSDKFQIMSLRWIVLIMYRINHVKSCEVIYRVLCWPTLTAIKVPGAITELGSHLSPSACMSSLWVPSHSQKHAYQVE